MSARHIEQHYGFGAARIAIRSEMHRVAAGDFRGDLDAILAEAGSGGPGAVFRRFAGTGIGLIGLVAFVGIVVVGLVHEETSRQDLEVVMMETPPVVPPAVEPMQELPAPPPVVAEPVVPEPVAPPPPPVVAEVKPEPPKPAPPKIEPVRIEPEIAKVVPPPVERAAPPVRALPKPVAKPRVQIEAVAIAQEKAAPIAQIDRMARPAIRPEARIAPRMDAPAAPAIDVPDDAGPDRSFRVAAAHAPASARARVIPGVAPAGMPTPDFDQPSARSAPTRGAAVARPSAPAPTRSVPRFEMAAATVAPPPPQFDVPAAAARSDRATPKTSTAAPAAARPGLSGVPLGDLQACVTDQEEDRLKQAVVAAAKTQGECVSSKGTYRFVETKNLNAFLMWIDRAPSRRVEDRCAELRYALDCLQSANRRASR